MQAMKKSLICKLLLIGCSFLILPLLACKHGSAIETLQPKIENILWTLQAFEKIDGKILVRSDFLIWEHEDYNITFKDDIRVGGTASTNTYHSTYVISDTGLLDISNQIPTTKIGEPSEGIGNEYRRALAEANSYESEGNTLRIFHGNPHRVMVFSSEAE